MTTMCSVVRVCPSCPHYDVIALQCYVLNLPQDVLIFCCLGGVFILLSFLSLLRSWGLGEVERWACPTGGEGGGSVPGRVGDGERWTVGAGGRLRCMQTARIPLCTGDDDFLIFRQDRQCEMLQLTTGSWERSGGGATVCPVREKCYTLPSPPLAHSQPVLF